MNLRHKNGLLIAAAHLIALIVFGNYGAEGVPQAHALLILIPVLWAWSTTRISGGLVLLGYMVVVSRGLPASAENYFANPLAFWEGLMMLAGLCLLFFCLGAGVWHASQRKRIWRIPLLLLLWTLPPLGVIGWGNPVLSAGWLFPDWHWFGLIACIGLMMLIAWRYVFLIIPLFLFVFTQSIDVSGHPDWQVHHTQYVFGTEKQNRDPFAEFDRHREMSAQLLVIPHAVHLYPETVGGQWNAMAAAYWQSRLQTKNKALTALLGTRTQELDGLYNSVIRVTADESQIIYRQRIPVPYAMWKPGSVESYSLGWRHPPVTTIQGTRTAFLMCYETLIALPVLHSLFYEPEHLATLSSVWWAPKYIKQAQQTATLSWARLFSLTISEAFNDG